MNWGILTHMFKQPIQDIPFSSNPIADGFVESFLTTSKVVDQIECITGIKIEVTSSKAADKL